MDSSSLSPIELSSDESDDASTNVASIFRPQGEMFNVGSVEGGIGGWSPQSAINEAVPSSSNAMKRSHSTSPRPRKFQRFNASIDDMNISSPHNSQSSELTLPSNESNDNIDEQIETKPLIKVEDSGDAVSNGSEHNTSSEVVVKLERDIKNEPSNQTEDSDTGSDSNDTKLVIQPTGIKQEYVLLVKYLFDILTIVE